MFMLNKFLNYFLGGSNHYPFINQWHNLTNFIHQYVSTNNDIVYLFQVSLSALLIFCVLFMVLIPIGFLIDISITFLYKLR